MLRSLETYLWSSKWRYTVSSRARVLDYRFLSDRLKPIMMRKGLDNVTSSRQRTVYNVSIAVTVY